MNVIPFQFQNAQIRVFQRDGDTWFVAKDVATLLGYSKPRNAISMHCRGALKQGLPTESGIQEMQIIPERDVYRLIMRSKLPEAEKFEDGWLMMSSPLYERLEAIRQQVR
ncbi:BRO-N domain-containing protein [Veronia nyctiphanis]|uniref:BRO-N domain-containing protein n=1 Tax=Veronia nyctiphanis TaxID=1278244 RepID=UPI00191BFCA7|nr:Bro-N domain-containing protein [Veronia nyctiphanis]